MTVMTMAARAATWNPLRLVRAVVATVRERFAEGRRLAEMAREYRSRPAVERLTVPGARHRAVRTPRVRRTRAVPRAPRTARHTPAPGRWRVELPPDWFKRFEASHRMTWARSSVAEILAGV